MKEALTFTRSPFYFAIKIILGNFWDLVGDDRGYIKG